MCSLHLTHPSVHTWSSGQPTVQRPGSSRGLPVGAGIRTHNLGLPRISSPTLYPLGQRLPSLANDIHLPPTFCDMCIPTRTFLSFNNDKPWFTGKLKQLRQAKEDAYRSGDKILYNQARNILTEEIRVAKNNYSEKLRRDLSANNPASVWTGLRNITKYKTPPPQSVENQQLADDLNVFYCRFEKARLTPNTCPDLQSIHSPTPYIL